MIFIAADHAGYELKNKLIEYLKSKGREVEDCGAYELDPSDDYPNFIIPCAHKVAVRRAQGQDDWGIVIGGSGQGEAIAANKVKGIRAAVYYGPSKSSGLEIVRLSREHNDTNVLALGARFMTVDEAIEAVDLWLSTKFDRTSRHQKRHDKITKIEHEGL